jgi:hypothetical protein
MDIVSSCPLCTAEVFHCHEVSVLHADSSSSCSDSWCTLPHHLHEWQHRCAAAAEPCWCTAGELVAAGASVADPAGARVQAGGRRYTETWLSLAS